MPEVNAQRVAYLGVFGEPISDALSTKLNLDKGIGLKLQLVSPGSPAAIAELKKTDIILSLTGQDIGSINDLRASIANNKPGDIIELKYISEGQTKTKNIILGARPVLRAHRDHAVPIPHNNQQKQAELKDLGLPKEFLDKFPQEDREKLMKLFKGKLAGLDLQELQKGLDKLEGFDLNLLPQKLNPNMNQGLKIKGSFNSRIKMLDQHGSITLESTKDGKIIELLDKAGKLQFSGPYNTEADKNSVPQELRNRVENLDIDKGLGFLAKPQLNQQRKNKMNFNFNGGRDFPDMEDLEKEMMQQLPKDFQKKLKLNLQLPKLKNLDGIKRNQKFEFKFGTNSYSTSQTDPQSGNRFTFEKNDAKSQVEVHDPAGKLLYNGPYNTDADKASVPNEYRDFLENLNAKSP